MGPQLYFDNYTAASDVTVLAICIVIGILIMTSFVTRTRPFFLFVNMLVSLALAVLSDMILHDSYAHTTNGKIAIEITESRTESDLMIVKTRIEELQHTGIKFYLDDFGTGYSNMERIMTLPFDIIKFDRSLVNASCTSERSREIVGRLAAIFADLDYAVLYEGIEDTDTEQQCIGMSASYLQGFKYSKPVPIDNLSHFFTKEQ